MDDRAQGHDVAFYDEAGRCQLHEQIFLCRDTRLPDTDLRTLFDANRLALVRAEFETELRELESYLDLAACEGEERDRAAALAPDDGRLPASVGWYLLRRA